VNPYEPPAEPAAIGQPPAEREGPAAHKPIRVWLLQGTCVLQLGRTVVQVATEFGAGGNLRNTAEAVWFTEAVFWSLVLLALTLALQRLIPRPSVGAPTLAVIWRLHGIVMYIQDWGLPAPGRVDAVALGRILGEAILLWLTASLMLHRKTRVYLGS